MITLIPDYVLEIYCDKIGFHICFCTHFLVLNAAKTAPAGKKIRASQLFYPILSRDNVQYRIRDHSSGGNT